MKLRRSIVLGWALVLVLSVLATTLAPLATARVQAAPVTKNVADPVIATIHYNGNIKPPQQITFQIYAASGDSGDAKVLEQSPVTLTAVDHSKEKPPYYYYISNAANGSDGNLIGKITGQNKDKFEVCAAGITKADGGTICSKTWTLDEDRISQDTPFEIEGTYVPPGANPGGGNTGGTGGDEQTKVDQSPTCTTNGDPLTYVLCPIFNGAAAVADYLFNNILTPFLLTTPIGTDNNDPVFKVWSNFRIYGNIFLVLAVLVVVIGQSIGGGLVDAYTAKKMLPRVLVAAILINLSIYIVAFLVDITNIIGRGLGDIMTAPLQASGQWNFSPNKTQVAGVFSVGLIGAILSFGGLAGTLAALFFAVKKGHIAGAAEFAKIALWAALMVALPIIIALIAVFATLVIRKGLILFLIMVSPVAFALYCLPNTEKYFKKWWDLLLEALMIYPIIVAIFAVADILSVTILQANGTKYDKVDGFVAGTISQISAVIIAFFLQFLPLLAIPFSFRFAGAALGSIYSAVTNGGQRLNGLAEGRREEAKRAFNEKRLEGQDELHRKARGWVNNQNMARGNRATRALTGFGAKRLAGMTSKVGGRDLESVMALHRADTQKRTQDTTGNGDDTLVRSATVDQNLRRIANRGVDALRRSGYTEDVGQGGDFRIGSNGQIELADITGKMFGLGEANTASKIYGSSQAQLQSNLTYAMGKATTAEQKDNIVRRFPALAASNGMSIGQAQGIWTGAAYAKQNSDRDYKHYSIDKPTGRLQMNGANALIEANTTQDMYHLSQQQSGYFDSMREQVEAAGQIVNDGNTNVRLAGADAHEREVRAELQQQLGRELTEADNNEVTIRANRRQAETILSEAAKLSTAMKAGSFAPVTGMSDGDDGQPIQQPGARGGREIGANASPETAEAMKAFVASADVHAGPFASQKQENVQPRRTDASGNAIPVQGATRNEQQTARAQRRAAPEGMQDEHGNDFEAPETPIRL